MNYSPRRTANPKVAQSQLSALGYTPNDIVYFRAISKSKGARKLEGTLEQHFKQLERLNSQGYGIYFVVNGQGHADKDVTQGFGFFIEHDNLPKEEQAALWKKLGLPEPTLQIDTGGKSIHSYWILEHPIAIADWRILQSDLLNFTDADRTIGNPSRVMRLAGFTHQKSGCESVVISDSGKRYSFEELRSTIPGTPKATQEVKPKSEPKPKTQASGDIGAILSDQILPRLSAEQIFNWTGHDFTEQPDGKLKGNCPWHDSQSGTSFWVTPSSDGVTYSGACPSCTGNKKLNALGYRYALKTGNPQAGQPTGPAFFEVVKELASDAGVQLPSYEQNGNAGKSNGDRPATSSGESNPLTLLDDGKASPNATRTLRDSIVSAIELGLHGSDLEAQKLEIAAQFRFTPQSLGIVWGAVEREIERRDGRSDRSDAIDSLLSKKAQRLDISRILPKQLATPLKRRAELLGSTPEVLLTALLPVIASQVKIGTKLHLSRGSEWEALPIFWTGIVGEPATAKSPSLNVFLKPLRGIQGQDIDRYKAEAQRYESDKEKSDDPDNLVEPKKPLRQLVDDITIEALARIQDEQPEHGCLIGVDELAGFVNSFGQYKGGKGGDKQKILSIRDGKGFLVTRAGKDDIMTSSSSFSLCGAIQPGVLAAQMGDFTDSDGYWSRFCWCLLPLLRKQLETIEDGPIAQKLRSDLEFIFQEVKWLEPIEYELSQEALALSQDFREEMEDRRMDHPNNTMKIVHGKAQGQVGEIALILHLLWGVGNDDLTPERTVSAPTFKRAIEVMRFYIVQAELIQALGQEVHGGEDSLYGKILELGHKHGWLKAADVTNSIRAIKDDKTKGAEYVRGLFVELEAMGKGELMGEGRSLRFKPFLEGTIVPSTEQPIIQVWTGQDLKDLKDTVTANPDAASSLRDLVPSRFWSQVGI